ANENFLDSLAGAWATRPPEAEFLGNPAFHRLFLTPRLLKPKLIVKGSGIDWLSVSAEWEQEGLKLSKADLERLASATGRFVKLPNSGWVELDTAAVQGAHEAMADMGVRACSPCHSASAWRMWRTSAKRNSRVLLIRQRPKPCAGASMISRACRRSMFRTWSRRS